MCNNPWVKNATHIIYIIYLLKEFLVKSTTSSYFRKWLSLVLTMKLNIYDVCLKALDLQRKTG